MLLHYRKRITELSSKLRFTDERGSQTDLLRHCLADDKEDDLFQSAADKKKSLEIQVTGDTPSRSEHMKETPRFNDILGIEGDSAKEDQQSQHTKADSRKAPHSTLSTALEEKEKEVKLLQSIIEDVKKQVDDRIKKAEDDKLSIVKDYKKESQRAIEMKQQLADEAAARQKTAEEKLELESKSKQLEEQCSLLAATNKDLQAQLADLRSTLDRLQSATEAAHQTHTIASPLQDKPLQADPLRSGSASRNQVEQLASDGGKIEPTQQATTSTPNHIDRRQDKDHFASPINPSHHHHHIDQPDHTNLASDADHTSHSHSPQVCITSPADVDTLLRELEKVRVLLENADKSLTAKQKEIDDLQRRNHELHEQTLKTHELLDNSEREINLLSRSIKHNGKQSHEQELKSLRSQLSSTQTELDYYKKKLEEMSGLENVHTRLLDANSTAANLTIKLREASFEIDNLSFANRELRDKVSELENDIIEKDLILVQANDATTRAEALETEVSNLAEENHQLQTDLRLVKGQLSIETDQTGKLLKKLESTEEELRVKRRECDQLRRDIAEIRARAEEMSSEVSPQDETAAAFTPLTDASQATADSYLHLRTAYQRDASQLKKLSEHNRKLCEAYLAQKSELQSLQASLNKLKLDYHSVCQEASRAKADSSSMPSLFKPTSIDASNVDSH